jgi:protein-S-isoprenylcysteine O-methyltransferase Ste14
VSSEEVPWLTGISSSFHCCWEWRWLVFIGLALLKPTSTVVLACGIGVAWLYVQALLEEIDLAQRLPEYRNYMEQVPRFLPRLRRMRPSI